MKAAKMARSGVCIISIARIVPVVSSIYKVAKNVHMYMMCRRTCVCAHVHTYMHTHVAFLFI